MHTVPANPFRLCMQLHITGRCNLRCKHCYIEERCEDRLSLQDIKKLIDNFCALVERYNAHKHLRYPGQINLTGGEPFMRDDLFDILEHIAGKGRQLRFAILTNGSLITPAIAARLARLHPLFVQVSIDGRRKTHDELRAKGNFRRTLKACDILHQAGIRVLVSFTANRMNRGDYPPVLRACRRHHVDKLWTDRLVPIGNGEDIAELAMDAQEYRDYVQMIRRHRSGLMAKVFRTEVAMTRSLQFMDDNGQCCGPSYICSAADSLITVDEYGNIYPCRRLPIKAGSILTDDLCDVYFNSPVMQQVRARAVPGECAECLHVGKCYGGSRCIAYAKTGRLDAADPGCWLIPHKTSP